VDPFECLGQATFYTGPGCPPTIQGNTAAGLGTNHQSCGYLGTSSNTGRLSCGFALTGTNPVEPIDMLFDFKLVNR